LRKGSEVGSERTDARVDNVARLPDAALDLGLDG
jgi:hypothetical protein